MKTRFLSLVYLVVAAILGAIGCLHMATTFSLRSATPFTRVWFFGAGIAIAQSAALNLLHRSYGGRVRGLRWTTRCFNILMLGFAALAGHLTASSPLQLIGIVGVVLAVVLLSFTPAAYSDSAGGPGNHPAGRSS